MGRFFAFNFYAKLFLSLLSTHFGDLCTFNGRAISSITKASSQIFQSKLYLSSFGPNVGFPAIQAS